jgi:hypothetical protein
MKKSHTYIHVDDLVKELGLPEDASVRRVYVELEGEYLHVICDHTEAHRLVRETIGRGSYIDPVPYQAWTDLEKLPHGI